MLISGVTTKFVALDNGLSIFIQQHSNGGVEYDVFEAHCEPIDGGILSDEDLESGLLLDDCMLRHIIGANAKMYAGKEVEDHVLFSLDDEMAEDMVEAIKTFGRTTERSMAKMLGLIRSGGGFTKDVMKEINHCCN